MTLMSIARRAVISSALVVLSFSASAQDISESHMKAAREAVSAIRATDMYDNVLPQAAFALKQQLIQQNPDLQEVISRTVDEKTLEMVKRRADLEKEVATAYAKVFPEQDLKNIATFYTSPTGIKLLDDGPIVTREVIRAADIWQRGIARDLAQVVGEELRKLDENKEPVMPAPGDTTPTPETTAPAQNN